MFSMSLISNKEIIKTVIINELKKIGVKHKEKKIIKQNHIHHPRKRIFKQFLNNLELTEVILCNGNAVRIPKFIAEACNRVLEQVEVEGIFRKAGSSIRQRDMRMSLEAGLPISKAHHVIDVANVIKYFFRELPEPLIALPIQETFLRSLVVGENSLHAILLTCLLLPTLPLNTLSFFMQFLNTVAKNSVYNKMTAQNLAIIFTPGLMPFSDINQPRFNNHLKLIQTLIENANLIGTFPESLIENICSEDICDSTKPQVIPQSVQKKKKRRSGSLTHMFNGFRKIVGAAIGSSEHLDSTPGKTSTCTTTSVSSFQDLHVDYKNIPNQLRANSYIKASKKRKFADPVTIFSAKKKKELLALLPSGGGNSQTTPLAKESKKKRLSFGGACHTKQNKETKAVVSSMERRWSIVGTSWNKSKNKNSFNSINNPIHIVSERKMSNNESRELFTNLMENENEEEKIVNDKNRFDNFSCFLEKTGKRDRKSEYDAIKERVEAIESRISQEFSKLRKSLNIEDRMNDLSNVERVQSQYEKIKEKAEILSFSKTDQLAKRLSRELKIRQDSDKIIRSPSARKIGTLRKRSAERTRLSRNKTWHISSSSLKPSNDIRKCYDREHIEQFEKRLFYSGDTYRNYIKTEEIGAVHPEHLKSTKDSHMESHNEMWTSGEIFFKNSVLFNSSTTCNHKNFEINENEQLHTPFKTSILNQESFTDNSFRCTPMLPPKTIPRRGALKTPNSTKLMPQSGSKLKGGSKLFISTPFEEESNGRASIARLRSQNAGMVMAKAKLFDDMKTISPLQETYKQKKKMNVKNSINYEDERIINIDKQVNTKTFDCPYANGSEKNNQLTGKLSQPKPLSQRYCSPKSPANYIRRQKLSMHKKNACKNAYQAVLNDETLIKNKNSPRSSISHTRISREANLLAMSKTPKVYQQLYQGSPRRSQINCSRNCSIVQHSSKYQSSKIISN